MEFGYRNFGIILLSTALVVACSDESPNQPADESSLQPPPVSSFELLNPQLSTSAKDITQHYVEQIGVDLSEAGSEIVTFSSSIDAFLASTNEMTLNNAKQAWLDAQTAYQLTTLHRYFADQLFDEQGSSALFQYQYQINHWPIVPGYVDYVAGYPDSGIVHDINVTLDSLSLRDQHGTFDVSEVTLGFHVIEFLLWGSAEESASRPASDFYTIEELSSEQLESGYTLDQLDKNRRRQLLSVITDALVEDFQALETLWFAQAPAIRDRVDTMSGTELIVILADSMSAMLTEELMLRSLYPMLNGDFVESIQSPYSRSTQNAVSSQLTSLERLLLEFQTENGTTLDLVFSTISDEFSEFFYQNFDASKSCLVLLYSGEYESGNAANETEIVECINLLTNMIDYNDRLKFDLRN